MLVMGGIVASMAVALYAYDLYQPRIVHAAAGEPLEVGPVRYVIEYDGTHEGDEETRPEGTFLKIRIKAVNKGFEDTRMSGGQFYVIHENGSRAQPVYGGFSDEDLLDATLRPGYESTWTTQFDVPLEEGASYQIGIRPTKEQESLDIGMVCLLNC